MYHNIPQKFGKTPARSWLPTSTDRSLKNFRKYQQEN